MFRSFLAATALLAGLAQAGLSDMRATIPGSLHQCQNISVFFFDTDDTGDKTLLLVPAADAATLGDGTVTLDDALSKVQPLQQISNINSADAASFPFFLKIEQDVAFSTFGFLSNGQGKNMDLDRSVMAPLPDALDCLTQVIAPATTSTTVPVVPKTSSSSTSSKTPSSSSPPAASTSGFVKALKASSSSKTSAIATTPPPASSVIPASAAPAPVSASSTSSAANSTAKAPVIEAAYLLSSFISISAEQTTDGLVSSAAITGGHVTGNYNGTILAVGSALFTPNNTLPADATTTNATGVDAGADTNPPILLSATYTFTIDDGLYAGDAVFVMGQTPLSPNTTVPALLMHLQPGSAGLGMKWANKTVLGKPSYINTTMFRIDAYVV